MKERAHGFLTEITSLRKEDRVDRVFRRLWFFIRDRILGEVMLHLFVPRFRQKASGISTLEQAIEFVYGYNHLMTNVAPNQDRREITGFLRLVETLAPITVVEIGAGSAGTFFLLSRAAASNAVLTSIDLPTEFFGGFVGWRNAICALCRRDAQKVNIIRANSHDPGTLNELRTTLGIRQVDVLFIDGDHSYDGVRKDFEMYSRLVRKGGIVALHDIVKPPATAVCEVDRFWREIKDGFRHIEILAEPDTRWGGIGVLYVP